MGYNEQCTYNIVVCVCVCVVCVCVTLNSGFSSSVIVRLTMRFVLLMVEEMIRFIASCTLLSTIVPCLEGVAQRYTHTHTHTHTH